MILFKERKPLHDYLQALQQQGQSVGFIPTMGALHEGHLSLIAAARQRNNITVCSLFVNPTQFNEKGDYEAYPLRPDEDALKLSEAGADVLFSPAVKEIYPEGVNAHASFDLGYLETILEGAYRSGHFQGVAQVMQQLLEIIHPDQLYLGQKDLQQIMIIRKLLDLLHVKIEVVICPTLREPDGLAMSSRNLRLPAELRSTAPTLYQTLLWVKSHFRELPFPRLITQAREILEAKGFRVDYIALADPTTLMPASSVDSGAIVCLVAAWLADIRLIDNLLLN